MLSFEYTANGDKWKSIGYTILLIVFENFKLDFKFYCLKLLKIIIYD